MALQKWSDNKATVLLQGNYDGYIQSSLLQLRLGAAISASAVNGCAVYNISENTTYKVRLYMDTRFRVAACSSIAMNTVMKNYYRDTADKSDTTVTGEYKEAEITSEAGQVYMPVVYWASGGSKSWSEVFDTIEVREQLSGTLKLKSAPTKTQYAPGEELDLTGISVIVAWSDGSETAVTDYTVSGFDSSEIGTKTVTVAYQWETVTFDVTVESTAALTGITVTPPTKVEYLYNEELDLTGMVVTAAFDDGTTQAVTEYEVSGYDGLVSGQQTVTVTYRGFTDTFMVTVGEAPYFTVTFVDWDGTVLDTQTVKYGEAATAPADPAREDYTFTGWDADYSAVVSDLTVTAQYKLKYKRYVLGDSVTGVLDLDTHELAVSGTGNMKDFEYPNHPGGNDSDYAEIQNVKILDGVTSIGTYAFFECTNLQSVVIPESVTSIGNSTFYRCIKLQSVAIPESVTSIGNSTFERCIKLQSIVIPESVTSIGTYAFSGCTNLRSIVIPESVTSIDKGAFSSCLNLRSITILNKTCKIYSSVYTIDETATLYGWLGSTAESYATEYSRKFVALDTLELTVAFKDWDGTALKEQSVLYGASATAPDTPVREGYAFTGWDVDFSKVTSDLIVTAQYVASSDIFTVVFEDWDGSVLKTESVLIGGAATAPEVPARTGYTFAGWDKDFSAVKSDLVVTAQYEMIQHTVVFKSWDETILKEEIVNDGGYATAPEVPEREGYTFTGWSIDFTVVTSDLTVIALYTINTYTVIFKDFDGQTLSTLSVEHGEAATAPESPTRTGYTFTGWDKTFDNVTSDLVVTAQYQILTFTVTFIGHGDVVLDTQTVEYGKAATAPEVPAVYCYRFTGWDKTFDSVTVDLTVTAQFTYIGKKVNFYFFTNKLITKEVEPGDSATPPGNITSALNAIVTWSGDIDNIQEDKDVYAIIRWQIGDTAYATAYTEHGHIDIDGIGDIYDYDQYTTTMGLECNPHKITSIEIGEGITRIGNNAICFHDITAINIPKSVKTIGNRGIFNNQMLKQVTMERTGHSLEEIGEYAFQSCFALESIEIPSGLKRIKTYAFHNCSNLKSINLPIGMEEIGEYAFMGCVLSGHINFSCKKLELGAFQNNPLKTFAIMNPDCVISENPFNTGNFDTIIYGYEGSTAETYATVTFPFLHFVPIHHDQHTVTFADLNNTVVSTQTIDCGMFADPPATLDTVDGFTFTKWPDAAQERIVADSEFKAEYTIQTYTVVFKDYNGTVIDTQTVRYLDDAIPPAAPTRTGYTFTGWDKSYTDIAADTTITATYTQDIKVTGIQAADVGIKNSELQVLYFTVSPDNATDKSVTFVSSDDTVVSVSKDGTIQANSAGTAIITITANDGSGVTTTCTVTVAADDAVTSLWLIPSELYLQIGKTTVIAADIIAGEDADTALVWSSSNAQVATVDKNGKVKGVAAGTATITARLKSDATIFATSKVEVVAKEDYIRELYADDSIHKETVIHSVDGKFDDITNADIRAESMVIKEAVCSSSPVTLGGCISNSFEILIHAKRFFKKEPSGEIQVYQKVGGVKVNLFHGVIDSAKKQEDKITRKLVAYDKMHTAGDINISSWFKKLKFPITVKYLRKQLFKKIGISCQSVSLPCDSFKIYKNYVYYTESNDDVVEIDPTKRTDKKHDIYSVPDTLKAVDVIRDICEVGGRWGWMNRTGAFEFVDPYVFDMDYVTGEKEKKYLHPIKIQDDNKSFAVQAVELYLDDKEVDPMVYVWGGGKYSNKRKYSLDDSNFIVSATRGEWPAPKNYNTYQVAIVEEIAKTMHDKSWVSFTCTQRFDPTIKIGSDVYYENLKQYSSDGSYKWTTYSAVLERTIRGGDSVLETISASVGPLSSGINRRKKTVDKTKKTEKTVSDLKREVGNIGSDYYGGGGGSGSGSGGKGLKAVSVTELPANPDSNTIYLIQGEVTVN